MSFAPVKCPACGADNEIDTTLESFYCQLCGKQAITHAALSFYKQEKERQTALEAAAASCPPVSSKEEAVSFLRRAQLFLEDGEYERAFGYCERVLDFDPENSDAYLIEFLSEAKLTTPDEIPTCLTDLNNNANIKKALRFANEEQLASLQPLLEKQRSAYDEYKAQEEILLKQQQEQQQQQQQQEIARKQKLYEAARELFEADDIASMLKAHKAFSSLGSFSDSESYCQKCADYLDAKYKKALMLADSYSKESQRAARDLLLELAGWKQAPEKLAQVLK